MAIVFLKQIINSQLNHLKNDYSTLKIVFRSQAFTHKKGGLLCEEPAGNKNYFTP